MPPRHNVETVNAVKFYAEEQELSAAEIGVLIDKTRNAVVGVVRRYGIKLNGDVQTKKSRTMRAKKRERDGLEPEVEVKPKKASKPATRTPTPYYPKPQIPYHKKPRATCCWAGCSNEPASPGKPYCNTHRQ